MKLLGNIVTRPRVQIEYFFGIDSIRGRDGRVAMLFVQTPADFTAPVFDIPISSEQAISMLQASLEDNLANKGEHFEYLQQSSHEPRKVRQWQQQARRIAPLVPEIADDLAYWFDFRQSLAA